ncbi:hydantoinase B/oxoprolinase family protein [Natrarchaeobius oligotrophus]|uniref:Hydantoinase B/oxoprolinase family protein n=1 Tax=Natrarchaeobius chitinivorans TaxID=1679083 RepID=A0A3N6MI17_NATCH|nr:hydantoinase B/oxoprolinase family protein [Natrarchaeobius chitinivorans]RQG95271.1 hydantoinase B/oxoprolinase family protein [Natrarchaeobius chitinivorans]
MKPNSTDDYDPVALEVIRNAIKSTAEEMGVTLTRTAYSTNIKDRKDLSCAVYSKNGELVAQAEHVPLHLGMMPSAVKAALKEVDSLNPGDSIMHNDPYLSGSHLPDVMVFTPVFNNGERVGIVGNLAHHVDVGGSAPGSTPPDATEIFQEGLRFPPVKIRKDGKVDPEIVDIFLNNLRTKEVSKGDLSAQISSNLRGKNNIVELAKKYGNNHLISNIDMILDYSESRMRNSILEIENDVGAFRDYIEGDGILSESTDIPIEVEVKISDDEIYVDFEGTAEETEGPLNAVRPLTLSCVYFVTKAVVDPDLPTNDGAYRPINVHTPEGTVVNANFPAPTGIANAITSQRIVDALLGAFKEIVPERVMTASAGTMNGVTIGGEKPESGEFYTYVETYGGGQGAMHDLDGMDGVHTNMTNTRNAPVEVLENTYPFEIKQYGLVENSAGSGKHRGGLGIIREILIRNDAQVTVGTDRNRHRPWGSYGGNDAQGTNITLTHPDGTTTSLGTKQTLEVDAGSTFVFETAGGGGWGDPLERPPEKVLENVKDGYISKTIAEEEYGVVITNSEVDYDATKELRQQIQE